ncbi:MAG: DNA-binding protein [Oscillospiraceae bacterium]|nr:DNA-binding protein [Oscillospiraceae bacterium]
MEVGRLDSIERTEQMTILMDFYGELLTDRQRYFMQAYYNENLSLAEIAEQEKITRQAVRDILVRSCALLERYEDKIRFCKRFTEMQTTLNAVEENLFALNDLNQSRFRSKEILDICNKVYEALQKAKGDEE